jgi:hypothetical protein
MREIRTPKVEDRVALPGHAGIFIVKGVDESKEMVDIDLTTKIGGLQRGIPWIRLTFLDEEP